MDGWNDIVARFRSLGGVYDNVVVRSENGYRGMYALDPGRDAGISVPAPLLFDADDIRLDNGELTLAPDAAVSAEARAFFEDYHRVTSWSGGKASIERVFDEFQQLPSACKAMLTKDFRLGKWFTPLTDEVALGYFVDERKIHYRGRYVLMPVLELTNHDWRGPSVWMSDSGISLGGRYKSEIKWRYRIADAHQMFRVYHFASAECFAYSLPFEVFNKRVGLQIRVGGDLNKNRTSKGGAVEPVLTRTDKNVEVSFLLLGDRMNPLAPVKTFRESLGKELGKSAFEFFEGLLFHNRRKFFGLMATVENSNEPAAQLVRKVCRFQLETLSTVSFQPT